MSETGPVMESHGFAIAKKYLKTRDKNSLWTPPCQNPPPRGPPQNKIHIHIIKMQRVLTTIIIIIGIIRTIIHIIPYLCYTFR